MAGKLNGKAIASYSDANGHKGMEFDPFADGDGWVPIYRGNDTAAEPSSNEPSSNEPSNAQIRAEAEAAIKQSMGRQRKLEELAGLKVSRIGERTLVTYQGTTYAYVSGELTRRNRYGAKGGGFYDVSGLAEAIYGVKGSASSKRLETYLDSYSSGGHESRRRAEQAQWGRAKRKVA